MSLIKCGGSGPGLGSDDDYCSKGLHTKGRNTRSELGSVQFSFYPLTDATRSGEQIWKTSTISLRFIPDQYPELASHYSRKIADWYAAQGANGSDKPDTNDGRVKN